MKQPELLHEKCKKLVTNISKVLESSKRNCSICGREIKAIETFVGFVLPKCKCETDKCDEDERQRVIEEKQKQINDRIAISGLGARIRMCDFDNYRVNDLNKIFFTRTQGYAKTFKNNYKKGIGLLLAGNTGNGKTHLAASILKSVMKQGYTASFIIVADLLVKKRMAQRGSFDVYMNELQSVDLLVLDDLGRNEMKDFDVSFIFSIINSRVNNMKPTIITSNMMLDEWKEKDHGRVYSRLKQTSVVLVNNAPDERKLDF